MELTSKVTLYPRTWRAPQHMHAICFPGVGFYLVSMDTKYICATIYRTVVGILRSWVENEYLTWKWIPDLKINTWLDDEYLTLIFLWVLACEVHSVTMDQGLQNYFIYIPWQSSRVFVCDVWIETHSKITFRQVFDGTSDFPYGTKTTSIKSFISSQSGPTLSITSENEQT